MPTHWRVVHTRNSNSEIFVEQSSGGNYQLHSVCLVIVLKIRRYVSIGIERANETRGTRVVQIITNPEERRYVTVVQLAPYNAFPNKFLELLDEVLS